MHIVANESSKVHLDKNMTDTEDDDRFGNEPEVEEPKRKRRKKRKRGRIITVEDMPRKVREEFRTDQKAEKFLRLLGNFTNVIQSPFYCRLRHCNVVLYLYFDGLFVNVSF